jgi:cytochrome bd ubiquinol oxidase subunit II
VPFVWSVILFALAMFVSAASIHPYIIPPSITIKTAAAPYLIQMMIFIVMILMLPIMLAYNAYNYLVFRGKTSKGGYGAEAQ